MGVGGGVDSIHVTLTKKHTQKHSVCGGVGWVGEGGGDCVHMWGGGGGGIKSVCV